MNNEQKHTELPWVQGKGIFRWHEIKGADGITIVSCSAISPYDTDEANARLIVKAVNNHYQLLEALRKVASYNRSIRDGNINYRPQDHIDVIESVIANAEGEVPDEVSKN